MSTPGWLGNVIAMLGLVTITGLAMWYCATREKGEQDERA